jgi:hypothetical protein
MQDPSDQHAEIEAEWRERFGEPPPIRTDVALMRKVLEAAARDGYGRPPAPAEHGT